MLNRPFTKAVLAGAVMLGLGSAQAHADSMKIADTNDEYAFADDLTNPQPTKVKPAATEPGAIDGSLEERYAKFQAEQKKRVEHFHDVVNRNHMRKYGVKVR